MPTIIWLIPALPLIAFLLTFLLGRGVFGRRSGINHVISVGALLGSWLLALVVAATVLNMTCLVEAVGHGEAAPGVSCELTGTLYTWINSGAFRVEIGYLVDPLAAVMLIVVTTISLLVHIYSIGYMAHEHGGHVERDPGYYRFFAYLPLFTFSMLMLVLANNFLELYVFWEAVGLCSYLLIGFWYGRQTASAAAKKAFIVNRVGDLGFGLGVMLVWVGFGSLDYGAVLDNVSHADPALLHAICLLLFVGAMGKSAQFPLHTWLPDAMEGPTPVSALIHAATMVTAGVYMVARFYPLFEGAPFALLFVAAIGTLTALLAAIIGMTQNDIKRVMAWSTVSQLGYMFASLGVGGPVAAIFHLFCHAFFKALLFLGAGSVMHAMRDETNMQVMGGLGRYMPVTRNTLWIGALALAGIFPFAGFWSKDSILLNQFEEHRFIIYTVCVLTAGLTSFYAGRMMLLTFHGEPRFDTREHTPHESPVSMLFPLVVLAVGSLSAGLIVGFPPEQGLVDRWLAPLLDPEQAAEIAHGTLPVGLAEILLLMAVSLGTSAVGLFWAFAAYRWRQRWADPVAWGARLRPLYLLSFHKFYFDELYDVALTRPLRALANTCWRFDAGAIDGLVNGTATAIRGFGTNLRTLQTGFVGNYALAVAMGTVCLLAAYLVLR